MPTKKPAKKADKKPTLKERAKTTLRKIVPAPKPSGRGSPSVGSGLAERGKSAVIKGRHRTEDELRKMGE
jgi:hypothetical protein